MFLLNTVHLSKNVVYYNREEVKLMYLCVKQQLKHLTKQQYLDLRELCRIAKNLYNVGVYNVRQYYFREKEYLNYSELPRA